jgi:phosphatidylinositol alpha-1,6-mannosyltransferase
MRVGLVAPEFPPDIGGVETYAWHLADGLTRLGHEVTVLTPLRAAGEVSSEVFCIEPVLRLHQKLDREIVQRYNVDVWHSMNAGYAWLALETAPVFVSVHGNDFLAPYHLVARIDLGISDRFDYWLGKVLTRRLMRRGLPRVQHVFANSRYTEEIFLQHHPSCRGKTSVASVGIADDAFAPHKMTCVDDPVRLITICRLDERRKNLPAVLEALSRLMYAYNFYYTIVGDGASRPQLEEMAAMLGLANRVTFAGFVEAEEKIELLRSSDLFVLPALATGKSCEGFGLVYLEANACGTPVLAARIGGAIEAVEEGVSGFFVDSPTADGIASALSRFLSEDLVFNSDACQCFARRFSWQSVTKHCISYYEDALI